MTTSSGAAPQPRTAAATAARRRRTQAALGRVTDTLARMGRDKLAVTVAAVARAAHVSRTFLYEHPDARAAIAAAMAQTGRWRAQEVAVEDAEQVAAWRERALNAEGALKTAQEEIRRQRGRIGELLGQVRDLEAEWTQEAVQRITSENTTLKQRVRRLIQDNRTLEERLQAARSNLRFQDRRIADLEAQLAPPPGGG